MSGRNSPLYTKHEKVWENLRRRGIVPFGPEGPEVYTVVASQLSSELLEWILSTSGNRGWNCEYLKAVETELFERVYLQCTRS